MEFNTPASTLKVFLVDSHELTRIGLRYALKDNPSYTIAAEADYNPDVFGAIQRTHPDIVILDIVPLCEGIQLAQKIKTDMPAIKVVVLVSEQDQYDIKLVLAAGIDAFCLKNVTPDRLFQILDAIRHDAIWLDPVIAKKSAENYVTPPSFSFAKDPGSHALMQLSLTQRECEVLTLPTEGNSNKESATVLGISTHTVKTHVRNLIQKMAVDDRTQAVVKALHYGLVKRKPMGASVMMMEA